MQSIVNGLAVAALVSAPYMVFADTVVSSSSSSPVMPIEVKTTPAASPLLAPLEERYDQADWVSLVKVKRIGDLVNIAMSLPGMVAIEGYSYTTHVMKGWKGADDTNLEFRVNLSDCHSRLKVDTEYVVFGKNDSELGYQSFSCDDLVSREGADSLVAQLDRFSQLQVAQRL